jgi:hypothetical protein
MGAPGAHLLLPEFATMVSSMPACQLDQASNALRSQSIAVPRIRKVGQPIRTERGATDPLVLFRAASRQSYQANQPDRGEDTPEPKRLRDNNHRATRTRRGPEIGADGSWRRAGLDLMRPQNDMPRRFQVGLAQAPCPAILRMCTSRPGAVLWSKSGKDLTMPPATATARYV